MYIPLIELSFLAFSILSKTCLSSIVFTILPELFRISKGFVDFLSTIFALERLKNKIEFSETDMFFSFFDKPEEITSINTENISANDIIRANVVDKIFLINDFITAYIFCKIKNLSPIFFLILCYI